MSEKDMVYYPQDEMNTFLLPVTRGCSYNRCAFCSMYKDVPYREVSLLEIETILMNGYEYTEKVFLTGADPLAIGFEPMREILAMIRKYLPYCACVASYASILNLSKYTLEELTVLHDEGLRLLYIGFESGSDKVLEEMNKAHRRADAIREAKKLNTAQLPFNSIIMYGIAGAGKSIENATLTAEMINQFHTNKVITMNLKVFGGTDLENKVNNKEFMLAPQAELLVEIRTLLEKLNPKKNTEFDTTHPTNMIQLKGILPKDREKLLAIVSSKLK
ncbi:MAG: radical SAM protein [Clostridium sp.]|nr:radical SAM protein [Clostridium sp.]